MPRKPRVQYPGAIRHVVSRGDRREAIFVNDVDRHDFLRTLAEACLRTGWQVLGLNRFATACIRGVRRVPARESINGQAPKF